MVQNSKIAATYNRVRKNNLLNTFVILIRYLIGFAFIPSGLKKILGERFTQLGTDNAVGFFFEGLYRSGFYWNFIGWAQVIAALLLMTQRFATAGALFFFFIVANIWVITISLHFSGTWVITSLLLLAVIVLLAWDYHKWKYIFYKENYPQQSSPENYPGTNNTWIITGILLFAWSITGLLLFEKFDSSNKMFSRFWLAGIGVIILSALYLNKRKNKAIELA